MRDRLKQGYYLAQKLLGRDRALLDRIKRENLVVVLNLHHVSPEPNAYWPPLTPEIFADLLNFLKQTFEVVLFRELRDAPSDRPLAVISFDDGYYDFIEHAVPLLDKHGLRANMNVIPSCVETGHPIWNVQLYDFLAAAPRDVVNRISIPGFDQKLDGDSAAHKLKFGLAISRFLKNRPRVERVELFQSLSSFFDQIDAPRTRMMNLDEVKQIAERHEIGAHSHSHESMEFESDEFFEQDVLACKKFFETKGGLQMETYAFPNGSHRPEQIARLESHGVRHILLVDEDYARRDASVFPRFTIYGSTRIETRFQALGINHRKRVI